MDNSKLDKNRGGLLKLKLYEEMLVKTKQGTTRHNEPLQAVVENKLHESALKESNNSVLERNRALLQYIATLANSNSNTDEFNYEFVSSLLSGGADINTADHYGQTIFHEVARSWNIDVARFLLQNDCDVNNKDFLGRTPLHVASAVNYPEMVEFLLQNEADIDARTSGDEQAPIHYAAKNGAVRSLKMLLGFKAKIGSLDSKNRTPLQLAAEWTRSGAAKVLLDEGAVACTLDSFGNSALCVLIDRIPHLALEALEQLHTIDIITMKEYYFLQHLEASRKNNDTRTTRTPLEVAVATRKYEVVTHPVMERLIHNKWTQFGRHSNAFDIVFTALYWVIWTSLSIGTPREGKQLYASGKNVWRIVLGVIVLMMTIFNIWKLVFDTFKTRQSQMNWVSWRLSQLQSDLSLCHPRWPQEQAHLKYEIKRVKSLPLFQAFDGWFYYDWVILISVLITIVAHFVFYAVGTSVTRQTYMHANSIVNLLVGFRILKYLRPFSGIGTLVLILGETSGDFVNWAFLFLLLLVPFSCSFWINYGNLSMHNVHGYHKAEELIFSVFRMSVGDEFNFEGLVKADPVMAYILVTLTLFTFTIVILNLLIALLSDTFSRVYNNAVANSIMQRAIKITQAENVLKGNFKLKYEEFMQTNCNPEVLPTSVKRGLDLSERQNNEMYGNIRNMKTTLDERFSKVYGKNKMSDLDSIVTAVKTLKDRDREFSEDVARIRELVKKLTGDNRPKKSTKNIPRKKSDHSSRKDRNGSISGFFGLFSLKSTKQEEEPNSRKYKPKRRKSEESGDKSVAEQGVQNIGVYSDEDDISL